MGSESKFTEEQKRQYDLRHYPVRPHVGVGGVIVQDGHVVLVKRKYAPNQGKWAIPGGHLKLGERAEDGALRECIEETGLDLKLRSLASVIDKIDRDSSGRVEFHYVLIDFWIDPAGQSTGGPLPVVKPASDAQEARFVGFGDLENYDLTPTVRELFHNLGILPKSTANAQP